MAALLLAGLAGLLASLYPCVLPILPIVLAAAGAEHRFGPLALAGGLALSFAGAGMVLGLAGFGGNLSKGFPARGNGNNIALLKQVWAAWRHTLWNLPSEPPRIWSV